MTLTRFTLAITLLLSTSGVMAAEMKVDADFPGGNVIVDRIDGDDIHVRPDLRDTVGDWFYWNFRVRGAAGRTVNVHFTKGNPIGVRGPAVSTDSAKSWRWLGADAVRESSFRYAAPANVDEVRFAFAFPYQRDNLQAFLDRFKG